MLHRWQAALASTASFAVGAALPLAVTFIAPTDSVRLEQHQQTSASNGLT